MNFRAGMEAFVNGYQIQNLNVLSIEEPPMLVTPSRDI
jgi:hypothetical protein